MDPSSETEADLRARIRQQELIAELGQRALETEDLDELLRDASVAVTETLDSDYCAIFELLPDGDEALVREGVGWREGAVGTAAVPAGADSHVGGALRGEGPVIVGNLDADERFSGPGLLADHDVVSGVGVLVGSVDDPWGVLGTYATHRREFTEHDANFVRSVANVIASAVENERAKSELEGIYGRISDAFFALDEEWRFTHLNERAHEMINPDGRTLVGETIWEQFPRTAGRKFESKYEHAMYEQETVSFEEYYPEPLDAWFEIRAYPSETGLSVYFRDVTERKEREQELERYERLVENLPVGVYRNTSGPDGKFVEINDTMAEIFGADSKAELREYSVSDLYPDPAERVEFSQRLERGGMVEDVELEQETLDGERIWISVTAMRTEEDGEVFFDGIVQDVTERKERERALKQTERRFEAIFEDPNILVGLLGPDGTVLDINQTAMEYIDADLDEVTGEPFWETPWWGEGDEVGDEVREWTERAADGEYVDFRADLTRPDGQRYTLEGFFRPVTDEDGEVVSIIVSDRDITERREYERQLVESERRYRTLAEAFPNGLVTLFDGELRYTLAAGQVFEDLPVSPDDLESRTPREVWGDDLGDALEPPMRAALDGGEGSVEVSYAGREWLVHAVPIADERGDVFAGMTMAQDITEQVEHERKLEETVEKLEESNERLESFASMLAHELRNPVTIGQIYSQQLPAETDAVEYVTEALDRIEDMVDVMLVLTRGREAIGERSPIDLGAMALEVWAEVDAADASLDVAIDRTIAADETYVRHLFRNLFENAVEHGSTSSRSKTDDAAEHGGGDVAVTVGELPTGFYVADDGVGIPPEERDAVFEQGYTTAAERGGTGLGLAFVEELAEVYEWECAVTESESGGARFEFTNVD